MISQILRSSLIKYGMNIQKYSMFVRRIRFMQTRTCSIASYLSDMLLLRYLTKKDDAKGDSHLPSPADVSNASSLTRTEIEQAN